MRGLLALCRRGLVVDEDLLGVAGEEATDLVEGSQVLIVKFIEVVEFKICARRPVETFLREFVLVGVGNAQADVVVVGNAFDSTPEE